MTITTFVPMRDTKRRLTRLAKRRQALEQHFSSGQVGFGKDGAVIQLKDHRPKAMPEPLRDVPMASIQMAERISPTTAVADGEYADGDITARVDTYVKKDGGYKSIKVLGTNGTTVEALNQWFDDLIAGKKADKNLTVQRTATS